MADAFVGEIQIYAFGFPPRGWALCNGQLLPISQNQALFALLGTNYGGNGTTNFALPDLRNRVPIHPGTGTGLSGYVQGQTGGQGTVTVTQAQLPVHTHALGVVASVPGNTSNPVGNRLGVAPAGIGSTYSGAGNATGSTAATAAQGGGQAHTNLQPFMTLNFCIALQGIFPSRN
jgi:microcystin-dependent protein